MTNLCGKSTLDTVKVTLKDIAEQLGLSTATVFRVLNGAKNPYVKIPEETKSRVFQVAKELGYTPNRIAYALVTDKTKMIALLVPELHEPFYVQVIHSCQSYLRTLGYGLLPSRWGDKDWRGLSVSRTLNTSTQR